MTRLILDEKKRSEICGILAVGGTRALAARLVGCSTSTIYRAARRDPDFKQQLRQAKGHMEVLQLKYIADAGQSKSNWRAAAWLLERKFPSRYGRRSPDVATVEQISRVLVSFAELIAAEIPDAGLRQQILNRLKEVAQHLETPKTRKRAR
jgi:transposase